MATVAIALLAFGQVLIYLQMGRHNTAIERAYIGFEPAIDIAEIEGNLRPLMINLRLINFGNTPARVIDIVVTYGTGRPPAPTNPRYEEHRLRLGINEVSVPKNGDFSMIPHLIRIPEENFQAARDPNTYRLWLFGYVRYQDAFGRFHKAGFGRIFVPDGSSGGRNLIHETQTNYNYDREINEDGSPKADESLRRYLADLRR